MNVEQAEASSRAFGRAFERCMEQRPLPGGQFEMLVVPAVVSLAFASEVGLKAVILRAGGSPRGHNLAALVGELGADQSSALVASTGMPPQDFATALAHSSRAFEQWRYIYELETAAANLDFLRRFFSGVQALIGQANR